MEVLGETDFGIYAARLSPHGRAKIAAPRLLLER